MTFSAIQQVSSCFLTFVFNKDIILSTLSKMTDCFLSHFFLFNSTSDNWEKFYQQEVLICKTRDQSADWWIMKLIVVESFLAALLDCGSLFLGGSAGCSSSHCYLFIWVLFGLGSNYLQVYLDFSDSSWVLGEKHQLMGIIFTRSSIQQWARVTSKRPVEWQSGSETCQSLWGCCQPDVILN